MDIEGQDESKKLCKYTHEANKGGQLPENAHCGEPPSSIRTTAMRMQEQGQASRDSQNPHFVCGLKGENSNNDGQKNKLETGYPTGEKERAKAADGPHSQMGREETLIGAIRRIQTIPNQLQERTVSKNSGRKDRQQHKASEDSRNLHFLRVETGAAELGIGRSS